MQKAVVPAALFFLLPLSLMGQLNQNPYATPKAELMGGYSLIHLEGRDMNGWNASLAGNVNKNLGIVADVSGHYSTESSSGLPASTESKLNFHSFLAGPRVTERSYKWLTPFAHALFGASRVNARATRSGSQVTASSASNDLTGFAMALGGGLDINASDRFFFRLIQADYFLIRADKVKHEGLRISAGILFRFGKRED